LARRLAAALPAVRRPGGCGSAVHVSARRGYVFCGPAACDPTPYGQASRGPMHCGNGSRLSTMRLRSPRPDCLRLSTLRLRFPRSDGLRPRALRLLLVAHPAARMLPAARRTAAQRLVVRFPRLTGSRLLAMRLWILRSTGLSSGSYGQSSGSHDQRSSGYGQGSGGHIRCASHGSTVRG
jgi:hypothetical protein